VLITLEITLSIILPHLCHEKLPIFIRQNGPLTLFVFAHPDDVGALLNKTSED
jgi:hypothetical protein